MPSYPLHRVMLRVSKYVHVLVLAINSHLQLDEDLDHVRLHLLVGAPHILHQPLEPIRALAGVLGIPETILG